MLKLFALTLLLMLDAAALVLASQLEHGSMHLIGGLLLHAAAAALFADEICSWFRELSEQRRSIWTVFCTSLLLPLLGPIGLMLILARQGSAHASDAYFFELPAPEFRLETANRSALSGIGSLRNRLRDTHCPAELRVQALLVLKTMQSRLVGPLLRERLDDPVEDIRLLAYGVLNEREKRLNATIEREGKGLEHATTDLERVERHKRLAHVYWEMIYQGFVQHDLRQHARTQALMHTEHALQLSKHDAALWMLLGKLIRDAGQFENAYKPFTTALQLGYPHDRVLPYLAEIAYRQHEFDQVRVLLARLNPFESDSRIAAVAAYWTRDVSQHPVTRKRGAIVYRSDSYTRRSIALPTLARREAAKTENTPDLGRIL